MNSSVWNARHKPIVVGLLLNGGDQALLDPAIALARKLGSPIELVHAVKPYFSYMGAGDVIVNPYYGYDRVINDIEEEDAQKAIDKLKQNLPSDIQVGVHILRDYSSEAISTIAQEVHAGLIICGIQKDAGQNIFGGMSTAFSLAAHSEIPVLIIPIGSKIDFTTRPRLMVADNLELEGRHALEFAIRLADEMDCTELCHAHVHQIAVSEVENMVNKVKEAMNLGRIPPNADFSSKTYLEQIRQKISDDLHYRFYNSHGAARIKPRYQSRVDFGSPAEQVHKAALEQKSQILVFGRHHLFHRRGFSLGKIPYSTMIEEGIATLIVPDTDPMQIAGSSQV